MVDKRTVATTRRWTSARAEAEEDGAVDKRVVDERAGNDDNGAVADRRTSAWAEAEEDELDADERCVRGRRTARRRRSCSVGAADGRARAAAVSVRSGRRWKKRSPERSL